MYRKNNWARSVRKGTAFRGLSRFPTLFRLEGVGDVNHYLGGNGDRILGIQGGLSKQLGRAWLPSRG